MSALDTGIAGAQAPQLIRFPCLAFGHRADDLGDGEVFVRFNGRNFTFDSYEALRDALLDDDLKPGEVLLRRAGRQTLVFTSQAALDAAVVTALRDDQDLIRRNRFVQLRDRLRRALGLTLGVALVLAALAGFGLFGLAELHDAGLLR